MKHPRSSSNVFDAVSALEAQDKTLRRSSRRDVPRSLAASAQSQIYHRLVECRILWQRVDQNSSDRTSAALEPCNELLMHLLRARQSLSQFPAAVDYAALVDGTEEEPLKEQLQLEYEHHREVWKEVLNRRHAEVRLHAGGPGSKQQFRVLDASFWQQVEATVQHEQLRSTNELDDTKVYQQLLKDFLATTANGAPVPRSKKSKATPVKVDRKASKGRKLRYTELSKLKQFTFPIPRSGLGAELLDEDAWFRSLLGGTTTRAR